MMKLYAKSRSDRGWPTIAEHSQAVCQAMQCIIGTPKTPTPQAQALLRFFKLEETHFEKLWINAMVAGALHDIGKANDGFQAAVRHPDFGRRDQVIRHEHLSALMLFKPSIRSWLTSNPMLDDLVILSAVATHHLKARRDGKPPRKNGNPGEIGFADRLGRSTHCRILADGLQDTFALAQRYVGSVRPHLAELGGRWTFDKHIGPIAEMVKEDAYFLGRSLRTDPTRRRLLLAVRSLLIAADAAGSALVRQGFGIVDWLELTFGKEPMSGCYVQTEIIDRRVAQLKELGKWHADNGREGWSGFQDEVVNLGPRALLLAPCGAGKTLAAWRWIAAQLHTTPARRAIFLYPTRGTATEGFRDYVSWAPEADAALVSGTAEYDLEGLFETPEEADQQTTDARADKQFRRQDEARLFALALWSKRVFSATVDTFLGFMANQYASLCLLPLLSDSVVVVDEIHSFSPEMFSALRQFLEKFDVPVLCMSASLPSNRRHDLAALGLRVFPQSEDQFADLKASVDHKRYRVHSSGAEMIEKIVCEAVQRNRKILWVVNRVDECQRVFRRMSSLLSHRTGCGASDEVSVLCYHSRFRLCDRRRRHSQVIRAFDRSSRHSVLAITTQVCEMSLDLDADILVTEAAPVTSLIQRMGRCCRQKNPGARLGDVHIYEPTSWLPYQKNDVQAGIAFRDTLVAQTAMQPDQTRGAVSQGDLARELEGQANGVELEQYSVFWESGFWANSHDQPFRDGEEYTVDCVLSRDVDAYIAARRKSSPEALGYVVPVPKRRDVPLFHEARLRNLKVAPDHLYHEATGYHRPEECHAQGE